MYILYMCIYIESAVAGLAHVDPNFQPLLLLTQAGRPYTNTHKHRTSYFKSTVTFMGPAKRWKCLSTARQKQEILATHQYKLPVNFSTNPTSGGSL